LDQRKLYDGKNLVYLIPGCSDRVHSLQEKTKTNERLML